MKPSYQLHCIDYLIMKCNMQCSVNKSLAVLSNAFNHIVQLEIFCA